MMRILRSRRMGTRKFGWGRWGRDRTLHRSCSMRVFRRRILGRADLMACTTRSLITITGLQSLPTRRSSTNSSRRGCLGLRSCIWPTPMCCRTTTRHTAKRSRGMWLLQRPRRRVQDLQDDFTALSAAAARFTAAGTAVRERQVTESGDLVRLNQGVACGGGSFA